MHHPIKVALLSSAAVASFWAAIAFAAGVDSEFKLTAIIAILCLGVKEFMDFRELEELEERYRWEQGREDVWGRRMEWRDDEFLRETD